jgi:hypothetical protein
MIGFIAPYKFTKFGATGKNRAISYLHTFSSPLHTHCSSQSLLFASWQRINNCLCNFNSHIWSSCHSLIPFLPFLQLPIPKTRMNYSRLLFYSPSTLLLYCCILRPIFCLCPLITPRTGPHRKHHVYRSFT